MGLLEQYTIDLSKSIEHFKWVIYGPPGAGKTSLSALAPEPYFLDYERSTDSITSMIAKGIIKNAVRAARPETLELTRNLCEEIIKEGKSKTIVIDTATRLQKVQMMLDYIPKQKSVKEGTRDRFTTYLADFNYSAKILDDFFLWLIKQPINVIITAHVRNIYKETKTEGGGVSKTLIGMEPDVTPALRESLTSLFSLVGYLTNEPGAMPNSPSVRKLRVNPTKIIQAKNRMYIQEPEILNPTYEGIITA